MTISGGYSFLGQLELVNVHGQKVWQAQGPIDGFSVSDLPVGLYWIRAFDAHQNLGTVPLWIVR